MRRASRAAIAAVVLSVGSAWAETRTVTVTARPPGAESASALQGFAFAIGTRFESPGSSCRIDQGPPAPEVTALVVGAVTLECGGETDTPRIRLPIVIAPVRVAGPIAAIPTGVRRRVHLTIVSVAPIGETIEVHGGDEVAVGTLERTDHGVIVPVTIAHGATRARLAVHAGGVELGKVDLAIAPPPPPPPTERPAWFAVDVGGFAGSFFPPTTGTGASALGNPRDAGDVLTWGPMFGGRVGIFPTRTVGLEVESALAMAGYVDRTGTALLSITRAQLATRVFDTRSFGARALVGADLLGALSENRTSRRDALGGVHYGVAFTLETRRDLWLRVQALHVVTAARDAGYAHCVDLQVGVVTRLGRRDRRW